MLSITRTITLLVAVTVLGGCVTTPSDHAGVRPEELAEIKVAIRKVTSSPVKSCTRLFDDSGPRNEVYVWTEDGQSYSAVKIRGQWHIRLTLIVESVNTSNQEMELTASSLAINI
jgi:hypothetical protein